MKNNYKSINSYNYYPTDRLFNLLKIDINTLKQYSKNNKLLRNDELEEIIYEIDMIQHILKIRIFHK